MRLFAKIFVSSETIKDYINYVLMLQITFILLFKFAIIISFVKLFKIIF